MTNLDDGVTAEDPPDPGLAAGEEAGEGTAAPDAPATEPEYDFLDTTDIGEKYVSVKVDGEDHNVPLSEALQGYQRQSDYTQKTQQIADQRQEAEQALRLSEAMQANPGLTMRVLAEQQGMSVEQFLGLTPGQQQQAVAEAEVPQFDDPLERQLYEERQARMALEQRIDRSESNQVLTSAVNGLQQQYGASEDDSREVVRQALQMGLGPQAFPMIYGNMQYQKVQAMNDAQKTAADQRQVQDAQRQGAAAGAGAVIGNGQASVNGTTPVADPNQHMTIREAFDSAYEQVIGS